MRRLCAAATATATLAIAIASSRPFISVSRFANSCSSIIPTTKTKVKQMMKGFGFLFMFLFNGPSVFMYLGYPSNGSSVLNQAGMVSIGWRNAMTLIIKRRKLECNTDPCTNNQDGAVNLEDYRPIDPVPSSTASIKPGPIQHGFFCMFFVLFGCLRTWKRWEWYG